MKAIPLAQKARSVQADETLMDLYIQELCNRKIVWSRSGCKVNGKKVGIRKFILAQMYAAAFVYDNPDKVILPIPTIDLFNQSAAT